MTEKEFGTSVKKGKRFNVPHGIIGHLTNSSRGSVHDRKAVAVTVGSSEKTAQKGNNDPKQVAALMDTSHFASDCHNHSEDTPP